MLDINRQFSNNWSLSIFILTANFKRSGSDDQLKMSLIYVLNAIKEPGTVLEATSKNKGAFGLHSRGDAAWGEEQIGSRQTDSLSRWRAGGAKALWESRKGKGHKKEKLFPILIGRTWPQTFREWESKSFVQLREAWSRGNSHPSWVEARVGRMGQEQGRPTVYDTSPRGRVWHDLEGTVQITHAVSSAQWEATGRFSVTELFTSMPHRPNLLILLNMKRCHSCSISFIWWGEKHLRSIPF